MKDKEKGEFGCKQRQEPLRGVHVRFDARLNQMIPQFGQVLFNQPVQLVKAQVERLEAVLLAEKKTIQRQARRRIQDNQWPTSAELPFASARCLHFRMAYCVSPPAGEGQTL